MLHDPLGEVSPGHDHLAGPDGHVGLRHAGAPHCAVSVHRLQQAPHHHQHRLPYGVSREQLHGRFPAHEEQVQEGEVVSHQPLQRPGIGEPHPLPRQLADNIPRQLIPEVRGVIKKSDHKIENVMGGTIWFYPYVVGEIINLWLNAKEKRLEDRNLL